MDLKQLYYFKTIVEEGNISAAARKLHISQPPLSLQIKHLEDECGAVLLKRGSRKVTLTDEGLIVYKHARDILKLSESAHKELYQYKRGDSGILRIGVVSTSGAAMLDRRVAHFHETYPNIQFELHEGNTFEILQWIESGIVEIAIVRTPFPHSDVHQRTLLHEPLVALMDKKYDWCPGRDIIEVSELKERPLIYHRRFEKRIEDTCHKYDFVPYNVCCSSDARTAVLWATYGMGIALIPRITTAYCSNATHMVTKELNYPDLDSELRAVWSQNHVLSLPAERFFKALGC